MRDRFFARCGDQLATLKAIASSDQSFLASIGDGVLLKTAHSLAGAGGTFGFPEISAAASALETLLAEQASCDTRKARGALDALVQEMEHILRRKSS